MCQSVLKENKGSLSPSPLEPPVARSASGVSVFVVDPGVESGWVWACIPHKWLLQWGVHQSINTALEMGFLTHGQVVTPSALGHLWEAEAIHAASLADLCEEHQLRTSLVTGGRLVGLSHLCVEDFILRERTSQRSLLSPVRITSGLYQELYGDSGFDFDWHVQSASDKSVVSDELLRELNLYWPGKPHACDAARHLVLFLRKYLNAL